MKKSIFRLWKGLQNWKWGSCTKEI